MQRLELLVDCGDGFALAKRDAELRGFGNVDAGGDLDVGLAAVGRRDPFDVGAGDAVEAGQPLAVVEAMKMENILRAQKAGRVKAVSAAAGDSLAVDQIILEME